MRTDFLFIESGRNEPISFLFIHLCDISCRNAFAAVWAEQSAMILRKIDGSLDDSIVVHFDEITFANLLIQGNQAFTVSTAHFQQMAASDFFTVWVFINFHIFYLDDIKTIKPERQALDTKR